MKKIINNVDQVENEMIAGMVKAYPRHLRKLSCGNVLVRADRKEGKVALMTGGGSGHEPAFAGYIGRGMLDAVAAGAIYTSPAADQIYEGIKAVATEKGVLLAIMNYTGDIMNFEMARELAEADGIAVEQVVVHDDIALAEGPRTIGRRGVAGTILVHKIAGALAETGAELADVKAVAQKVIDNVISNNVKAKASATEALAKIKALKAQLDKVPAENLTNEFAKLAKENSACPSSAKGGDLGEFTHGQMVKEFDEVAFKLPVNTVSDPVKTQFGYHLVMTTKKIPAVKGADGKETSPEKVQASHILAKIEQERDVPKLEDVIKRMKMQGDRAFMLEFMEKEMKKAKFEASEEYKKFLPAQEEPEAEAPAAAKPLEKPAAK